VYVQQPTQTEPLIRAWSQGQKLPAVHNETNNALKNIVIKKIILTFHMKGFFGREG
jgi:hypothetical protein